MMPNYTRGWMLNQSRLGILSEASLITSCSMKQNFAWMFESFNLDSFFSVFYQTTAILCGFSKCDILLPKLFPHQGLPGISTMSNPFCPHLM